MQPIIYFFFGPVLCFGILIRFVKVREVFCAIESWALKKPKTALQASRAVHFELVTLSGLEPSTY